MRLRDRHITPASRRERQDATSIALRVFSARRRRFGRQAGWAPAGVHAYYQESIVKVSYASPRREGSWKSFGRYLLREAATVERGSPKGFNAERNDLNLGRTFDAWQTSGDPRVWKLIVSPEKGGLIDLEVHAKHLIRSIEHDTGLRFEWAGVVHDSTDHPHAHIAIRGVSRDGREVRFSREYIKRGIRNRSREFLTSELGYRRAQELSAARERTLRAERMTGFDMALESRRDARGIVDLSAGGAAGRRGIRERQNLTTRLQTLRDFGLARNLSGGVWEVEPEFTGVLSEMQLTRDVTKSLGRGRSFFRDSRARVRLWRPEKGTISTGRVIATGLDDGTQEPYLLVATDDSLVHYVRDSDAVERPGRIELGTTVTLEPRQRRGRQRSRTHTVVHPHPPLPALSEFESAQSLRVERAPERARGRIRGRVIGYARDEKEVQVVVVEAGRRVLALATPHRIVEPGDRMQARGQKQGRSDARWEVSRDTWKRSRQQERER